MKRMRVRILRPEPIINILSRKDSIQVFKDHRAMFQKMKPSDDNLKHFVRKEYPKLLSNIIPDVRTQFTLLTNGSTAKIVSLI
jgi:hypothetical protein